MTEIQVNDKHYNFDRYVNKRRWASYYQQIKEVLAFNPESVLVIGVGDGLIIHILKAQGIDVKTLDFDAHLQPDFKLDVRKIDEIDSNFDVILCSQVLEHLPFIDFYSTIERIFKKTENLVLTIPIQHNRLLSLFKIQRLFFGNINYSIPRYFKSFKFDGEHYWELNTKGMLKTNIVKKLKEYYHLRTNYTLAENVYHHFFILSNCKK